MWAGLEDPERPNWAQWFVLALCAVAVLVVAGGSRLEERIPQYLHTLHVGVECEPGPNQVVLSRLDDDGTHCDKYTTIQGEQPSVRIERRVIK